MEGNRQLETIRSERTLVERTRELIEPLTSAFQQLSARQRQIAYSLFAVVAIAVVAIILLASRTDWKTLFAGLDPQDAREISAQLTASGIPFEVSPDGTSLRVAAEFIDKARLQTTVKGGPKSGRMGFELFDKPNWVGSEFDEKVNQNLVTPGAAQSQQTISAGLQVGLGTRSSATEVIMTQGELNNTANPLDLAITGHGFFQVSRPDGTTAYTRAGSFHLNNQGSLVTSDGDPIIPTITIPMNATGVTITQYGVVNATVAGQQNPSQLGQIQLATFVNPGGLNSIGSNLLESTLSSGDAILADPGGTEGLGTVMQGYLENSNVDVVTEFVQMVLAQRAYESNSKVIRAADDMYAQVNNMAR